MGLGQKAATVTALWTPIKNKKTGEDYVGLEKCASLERLDKEDKPLSDLLDEKLNVWVDENPEQREKDLRDFKKGFNYKHTDGYTYKIVQFDNGEHQLSRSKGFGAGGYRKSGAGFIHLRTVSAKICRVEQIAPIIDSQADNDNYELIQLSKDEKGDKFLLLNKKPYTPTAEGATNEATKTTKETESETEESNNESTE